MMRDPVSKQQLRFERQPINPNPLQGPYDPPFNSTTNGDMFVAGFAIGGILGAIVVYVLERL